ncbi:MAG TPA: DEAD/DEAH box helicase family protein [Nitrososphaeraceae archaeon]|nr:DEAD/DEAH box helicase family protein [Nitrososphaeraceae archaeon]
MNSKLKEAKKLHQKILADVALKKIKKWRDVAIALSLEADFFGTESNRPAIWKLVKKVLNDREQTLEREPAPNECRALIKWTGDRGPIQSPTPSKEQEAHVRVEEPIHLPPYEEPEDIILPEPAIKIRAKLIKFQDKAARQLWKKLMLEGKPSTILQAAVGLGKTFMLGRLIRAIIDSGYLDGKTVSPWPIMYVTKPSVIEQTKRVLVKFFGIDIVTKCHVTSYDQLRATFGSQFIKVETVVKAGEAHLVYRFLPNVHPCIFIWDECHSLKNEDSQQHKIGAAVNNIDPNSYFGKHVKQIFTSATLCTSVAEAKCMVVSTRMEFIKGVTITNEYWPTMARQISAPADPYQKSEAAMDRLMDKLDDYVVHVKGVRPQFRGINRVLLMQFQNQWERNYYNAAWDRYVEFLRKMDKEEPGGNFALLAQFTMFRKASEYVRTEYMAKDAWMLERENLAPVMICNYKQSITKIVKHLILDYGIPRSKISIIWGGETQVKAYTEEQAEELLARCKRGDIIPTASQLKKLEEYLKYRESSEEELSQQAKDAAFIEKYDLGPQNKKKRQHEIDKFQQGKAIFCLYTYKAGGVGLSLHHSDDWFLDTPFECRRKPNGYVYEEDIPKVPVRQRATRGQPTYSPIEAVQGFGRVPRLTSLSDTDQAFLYYAGTIEEAVADRCSQGLKCLKKTIRTGSKESWEDIIIRSAMRGSQHVQAAAQLAMAEIGVAKQRFEQQENVDDNIFEIDLSEEDEEEDTE